MRDEQAAGTLAEIEAGTRTRTLLGWVPLMAGGGDAAIIARWVTLASADPDARARTDHALIARTFARLTPHVSAWHAALEGFPMEETVPWMDEIRADETLRSSRATLLRLLNLRHGRLPGPVITAIAECIDPDRLAAWLDAVVLHPDLADWRRAAGV